jgi:hypothetical protein
MTHKLALDHVLFLAGGQQRMPDDRNHLVHLVFHSPHHLNNHGIPLWLG